MIKSKDGEKRRAWLVLKDGTRFEGVAFGAPKVAVGEVVFTTGMTGYEEVITDPSYCGQLVTMTSTHIGNTGINLEDREAEKPSLRGLIVNAMPTNLNHWRSKESLDAYLARLHIPAIAQIDTRTLTRAIRDRGAQMAAFGTEDPSLLHDRASDAPPMAGLDLTTEVSTRSIYKWTEALNSNWGGRKEKTATRGKITVIDFGVKYNILRHLVHTGFDVTVVPCTSRLEEIHKTSPDAIFLSNGPGDPAAVGHGVEIAKQFLGKKPIFAICLGHQIVSQALGATTYKLKFGHRGMNQPVHDLKTGKVEITTQNHGFCVDMSSVQKNCTVTHLHLNDGTCEGIEHPEARVCSIQYHPEAGAGPHDSRYIFDRFASYLEAWQ